MINRKTVKDDLKSLFKKKRKKEKKKVMRKQIY